MKLEFWVRVWMGADNKLGLAKEAFPVQLARPCEPEKYKGA